MIKNTNLVSGSLVEEETQYTNTHNSNCLIRTESATNKNARVLGELTAWLPTFTFREKGEGCPGKETFKERDIET